MPPINNIRTSSPTPDVLNVSDLSTSSVGHDGPHPLRKSLFHWMNEAANKNGNLKARNPQNSPTAGPVYQKPKSLSYNDTSTEVPTSTPLLATWNPTTTYSEVFASFEKSFEEFLASRPAQSMSSPPTTSSSSPRIYSNPTDEVDPPPASPAPKNQEDGVEIFFETNFSASSPPKDVLPESYQEDFPSFESASPIKIDRSLEEAIIVVDSNKDKSIDEEEFDDFMRALQKDLENEANKNDKLNDDVVRQQEDLEYLKLMRDFEEEFELNGHDEDLQSEATEASSPMDTETFQELRKAFNAYTAARGKKVEFREDVDVHFFQRTSSEKRSLFRKFRRRARRNKNASHQEESKEASPKDSSNFLPDPISDMVRLVQTKFHELEEAGVEWKKKLKSLSDMNVMEVFSGNLICASPNQSVDESNKNNGNVEMNQKEKLAALSDLVESMDRCNISDAATAPTTNTAAADTTNQEDSGDERAKARWQGFVKALERKTSPQKKTHRRRLSADRDKKRNVVDGAKRWAAAQKSPASVASRMTETTTPSTNSLVVPLDIFVRSPSKSASKSLQQPRLVDDAADDRSSLLRMRLDREEVQDIARAKREAQNSSKKQHKRSSSSVSPVSVANVRSF